MQTTKRARRYVHPATTLTPPTGSARSVLMPAETARRSPTARAARLATSWRRMPAEPHVQTVNMAERVTTSVWTAIRPALSARGLSTRCARNALSVAETTCTCRAQPALPLVPLDGRLPRRLRTAFSVIPSVSPAKTPT
jgi:hypothetical protein